MQSSVFTVGNKIVNKTGMVAAPGTNLQFIGKIELIR